MRCHAGAIFAASAVAVNAQAQLPEDNPIPASGGALIIQDADKAKTPHALEAGWGDKKTCHLLEDNPAVRAFRCTFEQGEGHERHYHEPHFGYILEGGPMKIQDVDGKERVVKTEAGRTWWAGEAFTHSALNVGDKTSSYLIVEPKSLASERRSSFRQALDHHVATISRKDIDDYADTLTDSDDLNLIFPDGTRISSTEGVIDFHEDWFEDGAWRFAFDILETRVTADMAYAFGKTRYQEDDASSAREAWLTLVFAIEDGEWRLIHDQNTRIQPAKDENK
ncbi:MAG: nuclear transport factor 2 family protein [Pseudomonadota bacterium]